MTAGLVAHAAPVTSLRRSHIVVIRGRMAKMVLTVQRGERVKTHWARSLPAIAGPLSAVAQVESARLGAVGEGALRVQALTLRSAVEAVSMSSARAVVVVAQVDVVVRQESVDRAEADRSRYLSHIASALRMVSRSYSIIRSCAVSVDKVAREGAAVSVD